MSEQDTIDRVNTVKELASRVKPCYSCDRTSEGKANFKKNFRYWMYVHFSLFWIRRRIGRWILPKDGAGICLEIDLNRMTKEQNKHFHAGHEELIKAGISCDTGYGGVYDMEFDWSLKGNINAICKGCGYQSIIDREQYEERERKEKTMVINSNCNSCKQPIIDDHYIIQSKFRRTKNFHTDCYYKEYPEESPLPAENYCPKCNFFMTEKNGMWVCNSCKETKEMNRTGEENAQD